MSGEKRSAAVAAAAGAAGAAVAAAVAAGLWRLGRRSGVTRAELVRSLPGDELVPAATFVADRATVLSAPASAAWPWIVQLGKERAGWYVPARLERLIWKRDKRGLRHIRADLQDLSVGDRVPDWGPGAPQFEVVTLDPPHALVYLSRRDRDNNWRWPAVAKPFTEQPGAERLFGPAAHGQNTSTPPGAPATNGHRPSTPPGAPATNVFTFSWALVLDNLDGGRSRLQIRLRAAAGHRAPAVLLRLAGGLIDYLTVAALFAGLDERLRRAARQAA